MSKKAMDNEKSLKRRPLLFTSYATLDGEVLLNTPLGRHARVRAVRATCRRLNTLFNAYFLLPIPTFFYVEHSPSRRSAQKIDET